MTSEEFLALVGAMAQAGTQLKWPAHRRRQTLHRRHSRQPHFHDRCSIVAAHGLTIPKTSSRAITSPAGTADTMEVVARVDLGVEEMKDVVAACNGCLVWGGTCNLSPADDILISVERPLSLDTREQMVASIIRKSSRRAPTHLLIDLPVGPTAKFDNSTQRCGCANCPIRWRPFRNLCGSGDDRRTRPIGNGIGPVLEARDVMAVLTNDPDAPADLREKSLRLAAHLLESDPQLRGGAGYARARDCSTAARP